MKVIELEKGVYAVTVNKNPLKIYSDSRGTKAHAEQYLKISKALQHIDAAKKLLKSVGRSWDSATIGHAALDIVEEFDQWNGSSDWRA
jgi:hypothetical protein